jgi:hypothetical protein
VDTDRLYLTLMYRVPRTAYRLYSAAALQLSATNSISVVITAFSSAAELFPPLQSTIGALDEDLRLVFISFGYQDPQRNLNHRPIYRD